MKKLVILLTLVSMVGLSTIGCGKSDEKLQSSNNVETNYEVEKVNKESDYEAGKEGKEKNNEVNSEANGETDNEADVQENMQIAEHSGDAEKVLFDFFEAMISQDIERAKEYVLYDDLGFPFSPLEDALEYYLNNKPLDIIKVEELSEDMKLIYVNFKTPEAEVEDSFVLKKVNDAWYIAPQGVISRQRSIYTDEQVKDGEVGIYLKDIYHSFNKVDIYVIHLVNNTGEKLRHGFVNKAAVIYENEAGKKYFELDNIYEVNPYSSEYLWLSVDSTEGPIKSIILKEVMLGLQPKTSEVEVFIGEMVAD